jgi:acyl-CoA synthetase (AMP-forming)/AMP-acid ligase II
LRDEDGQLITADSTEGEIYVQSPSVMLGYFNNPDASEAALTNDRWLRTGDWGYKKGSLYFISSRRTDLILRGAENVYPQEIELILDAHEHVKESAVIGVPHDDLGEEVMAIISSEHSQISDSDLATWVRNELADFKVPSKWKFINSPLPRNASGKLMKHVLIDSSKNTMVEEDE